MLIDAYKVAHWMNVRKLTPEQVASRADLTDETVTALLTSDDARLPDESASRLGAVLQIDASQIARRTERQLTAITQTADEFRATRRPIQRDGIHFYNYYSMAGPPGKVAPVVLDILCPPDRLPQLNNGHLEPAITLNLGPGDINGRWGEELSTATWQVLAANRDDHDAWIVGESYVEPAYCPHSYSLNTEEPARIISYTAASNLSPLLDELNEWPDHAFATMQRELGSGGPPALLAAALARRGYDVHSAAQQGGADRTRLERFLGGDANAMTPAELRALAEALGFDYRPLLPAPRRHDSVGKTCATLDESRRSVRRFRGYTVASMASAPHLPDLSGLFVKVDAPVAELDLCDSAETHLFVASGEVTLAWRDAAGGVERTHLGADGSAWIAPFVEYGLGGSGAVVKLGSGPHVGYLDQLELSNTYETQATLRRGRKNSTGWGYDATAGQTTNGGGS